MNGWDDVNDSSIPIHPTPRVDFRVGRTFHRSVTRQSRPILVAVSALLLSMLVPFTAAAEEGESAWSVGAGLMTFTHARPEGTVVRLAPIADVAYRYAVDDFWELGVAPAAGPGFGGDYPAEAVGRALFETRYVIDALTWVPYLCFGIGVLARGDGPSKWDGHQQPSVDMTGHAGLGVEWRPARSWSLGLVAKYHATITDLDQTVGPIEVGFSASWYVD